VAQGVPGKLRPRIFSTFGTTRVVGRQPYAPAAFTPGEISGTHFQRLSRPQGYGFFFGGSHGKKSPVIPPGIDPGTARLVAQHLYHYATPDLDRNEYQEYFLRDKGGRCLGLTTLPLLCADCLQIWEPQAPGTLRACPGL